MGQIETPFSDHRHAGCLAATETSCKKLEEEPCKPSPFSYRAGYVIAEAGLFAFLQQSEQGIRATRPFPLAWSIYNKLTQNDEPVCFIRARFQGFAAVNADSIKSTNSPDPLPPGHLLYLVDGPMHGRRMLSPADGSDILLQNIGALPVSQSASSAFLRMVRAGTSGQSSSGVLSLELTPKSLSHPGVLCLYLFSSSNTTCAQSIFIKTPWVNQNNMETRLIDYRDMDYAVVFLLHEVASGYVDMLHPVGYEFQGFRYRAEQDSIVSTDTGKKPHGRQSFPLVYRASGRCLGGADPASRYAVLRDEAGSGSDVQAVSFIGAAKDIHMRLSVLEEAGANPSVASLDTLRREVLDALSLISEHYMVMRSIELALQSEGRSVTYDEAPLPLKKVIKAYGVAINQARFQLHDILYNRLPRLRRTSVLVSVRHGGSTMRNIVAEIQEALASEPQDADWLSITGMICPALLDQYVFSSTGQSWGPFQSLRVRLAELEGGKRMICCDTEAGKVLLLTTKKNTMQELPGGWILPTDICVDGDTVLILDTGTGLVSRLDTDCRVCHSEPVPTYNSQKVKTRAFCLLRLEGRTYYLFEGIGNRDVWCIRQEGNRTESLFKLSEDVHKFAGWAVWKNSLVFASANHAMLYVYTPADGTWKTMNVPVVYPQFMGLSVAGDFAYLNCPPFIIKYDLCLSKMVYAAYRPQLVGIYPSPWKCFYVLERGGSHVLYMSDNHKVLHEYIVHSPRNRTNY